jgi:Leucine-rich repeat (LRR) protein
MSINPIKICNPNQAVTLADVFKIDGFVPDRKRDGGYKRVAGETVSQVQGTPAFCQKFVQWIEQNPNDWPDLKAVLTSAPDEISRINALILIAKTVGHIFNFTGSIFIAKDRSCEFEGFSETFVIPRVLWRWNAFAREDFVSKEAHAFVANALLNAVWHDNCSKKKLEEVFAQIHNPSYNYPILIGSGWVWHSTYVIFYKDPVDSKDEIRIACCNRGADSGGRPGIVFLKVKDKSKITLDFLQILANRIEVDQSQYKGLQKIKEELGAEESFYIKKKKQKSGNCTYANLKAAIYVLLIVRELEFDIDSFILSEGPITTSLDVYKSFVAYDANQTLKELAQDFPFTEVVLAPVRYCERIALLFCGFAFKKASKPKKINFAVLQKMIQSIEACPPLSERVNAFKTSLFSEHVIKSVKGGSALTPLIVEGYSFLPIEDYSGPRRFNFFMMNLREFPPQIAPCTNLRELHFGTNHIRVVPPWIGRLLNLQKLDLEFNIISEISEEMGSLTNLKKLNLNANQLGSIPPVIERLINLKDLNLARCQVSELSERACNLTNLKNLSLEHNAIRAIPSEIRRYVYLKQLYLHNNKITCIPPEIGNCLNLEILDLSSNKIQNIPPAIANCIKLRGLHLGTNKIEVLPIELGHCSALRTLVLSRNRIKILPPELFHGNLEQLSCDSNQIQHIPPQIEKCSDLEVLHLNLNLITTIPQEIMKCSSLQVCNLEHNQIGSAPDNILALFNKKSNFSLLNNPVKAPKTEA